MIDPTKVVAVAIDIRPPVGADLFKEPTAFTERLLATMADGSVLEATPEELPRLAARFFARYLGCCDAYNTQLRITYGGRGCKTQRG